jgi:arabinofuranosyltransferase
MDYAAVEGSVDVDADPGLTTGLGPSRPRLALSWGLLAVPLVIVLCGSLAYIWVQEDAFINFRVIQNLLAGYGPVFNVGERVEAYSDPLWVFLLAGVHELVPIVSLEWSSVFLGIAGTTTGVVLGGRAVQRLGESRQVPIVVPIGLLIFSVVAGVWEFTTGGLEMGMVFAWIGSSFWLLVRTERRRTSAVGCAFVMGLGPLIRPELLFMSAVFLVSLAVVIAAPGWLGSRSAWRRWVAPLFAAATVPVLYELWRMAYFAMIVATPALAKSGTGAWWSQGFTYLWNFVSTYWLWIPFALAIPLMAPRLVRWWRADDRLGVVVLVTPSVAGLADLLYVVHVGGDYMHARLLLPAFLGLCLPIFVGLKDLRTALILPAALIALWSIVCLAWLRMDPGNVVVHGIANERSVWIDGDQKAHPMVPSDYRLFDAKGAANRDLATTGHRLGRKYLLPQPNPLAAVVSMPANSTLPFNVAANVYNIGVEGLVSGPRVYVFDTLSLANPIGSHTVVTVRGRPGHEKVIGPAWMIGRFGVPGERVPTWAGSPAEIAAARHALACAPLSNYLQAITAHLTISLAWEDVIHSFTYTTMSYSSDPIRAAQTLCSRR